MAKTWRRLPAKARLRWVDEQHNRAMSHTLQNNDVRRQKNVLSADSCSHLHLSFFGFERTFYYVLNWLFLMFWTIYQKLATQHDSRWMSASAYCCFSVSTNARFQKLLKELLDSALACLFASNDSKTSFEQRKNARWTDNWDDSLKTHIWPQRTIIRTQKSNVCSNYKFVGDMGQYSSRDHKTVCRGQLYLSYLGVFWIMEHYTVLHFALYHCSINHSGM
jgi:hypothetical protein